MRAIHARHSAALFRFLLRLTTGERQLAEDLFQETMLRAWRTIDRFATDGETQRRWLWTVARRVAIDAARTRKARPAEVAAVDTAGIPADPADPAELVVAAVVVRQALPKLTAEHRAVLVDIYFRGLGAVEVAARLGVPEGTVRSRVHYALRALRKVIAPGGEPQ